MSSLFFQICSLFYIVLIMIIFFSKKKLQTLENHIYISLVLIVFLTLIIDMASVYLGIANPTHYFTNFLCKFYLVCLISWIFLFTYYIFVISSKTEIDNKKKKKGFRCFISCLSIASLIILLCPLYVYSDGKLMYTYGPSAILSYAFTGVCIVIWLICLLANYKKIKEKKYFPAFLFIVLAGVGASIQAAYPEIILVTSVASFITLLTYFTIENPDLKLINELNIAREQAEKANNAKTDFLSNMSHEIRTPLNAIVGFSQALSTEDIPDSAKEEVKDIMTASESLLDLVNGILDISKIEANKLEIVNTEYSTKKVFKDLVSLTKSRLGEKPLELRISIDQSIPAFLYGDYVRLKQIVLNILTNSIKYTKEGYIEFKVSAVKEKSICRLIISVEDSGIGIAKEKIDKLFTKFERFDVEKNITIEGTGLGLAITKKLVELMQGKIVVQSVYGRGSRFTVAIDQRIVDKPISIHLDKPVTQFKEFDASDKKILIVDDNKVNLKVATRLLRDYQAQVTEILSGQECLDLIHSGEHFDLILLDDMMPRMSGVETLQHLKEDSDFSIPTVALTANAISGMKEKYLNDGFDDYLSKPIEKDELNRVIHKFLADK